MTLRAIFRGETELVTAGKVVCFRIAVNNSGSSPTYIFGSFVSILRVLCHTYFPARHPVFLPLSERIRYPISQHKRLGWDIIRTPYRFSTYAEIKPGNLLNLGGYRNLSAHTFLRHKQSLNNSRLLICCYCFFFPEHVSVEVHWSFLK